MASRKSISLYIMLSIFLFCIILGCAGKQTSSSTVPTTPQPTATPSPQPTTVPTPQPTVTLNPQLNVTMLSPKDGSNVSFNEPVYGNSTGVYGSGLHIYVLINPVATSNIWWVQPEAEVSSDGTWHVNAQFGRSAQEDVGTKYWVTSVVTSNSLPIGQTSYPSVEYNTKNIILTRK